MVCVPLVVTVGAAAMKMLVGIHIVESVLVLIATMLVGPGAMEVSAVGVAAMDSVEISTGGTSVLVVAADAEGPPKSDEEAAVGTVARVLFSEAVLEGTVAKVVLAVGNAPVEAGPVRPDGVTTDAVGVERPVEAGPVMPAVVSIAPVEAVDGPVIPDVVSMVAGPVIPDVVSRVAAAVAGPEIPDAVSMEAEAVGGPSVPDVVSMVAGPVIPDAVSMDAEAVGGPEIPDVVSMEALAVAGPVIPDAVPVGAAVDVPGPVSPDVVSIPEDAAAVGALMPSDAVAVVAPPVVPGPTSPEVMPPSIELGPRRCEDDDPVMEVVGLGPVPSVAEAIAVAPVGTG